MAEEVETTEKVDVTAKGEEKGVEPPVDRTLARLKSKLFTMLDKLEEDIAVVESKIGDKFHMLDRFVSSAAATYLISASYVFYWAVKSQP